MLLDVDEYSEYSHNILCEFDRTTTSRSRDVQNMVPDSRDSHNLFLADTGILRSLVKTDSRLFVIETIECHDCVAHNS